MIRKGFNDLFQKNTFYYVLYFIIPLISFSAALYAYWPGLATADSSYQWEMAKGMAQINGVHPVAHTVLIKFLLGIWDNPAAISLFGVLFLSLSFGFCLLVLDIRGVSWKVLICADLIFAFSPNNMAYSVTMWKDIPYAASLLASTGLLIYIVTCSRNNNGTITLTKALKLSLYLASITLNLCWAFRYNGIIIALGGLAFLAFYMVKERFSKRVLPVLLTGLFVGVFSNYILPEMVNALPNTYDYTTKYMVRQVIGADLQNEALSEENSQVLWAIFDKDKVLENFIPEDFSSVLWNDEIWATFGENPKAKAEIKRIFFETLKQNPGAIIQNAIQSSNLVWGISKPEKVISGDFVEGPPEGYNPMGIKERKNFLSTALTRYVKFSQKPVLFSFFWKNGIWLLIICLLLISLLKRKVYRALPVFAPVFLSTASCLIAITCEYRYVWPLYTVMPILVVYFMNEFVLFYTKSNSISPATK